MIVPALEKWAGAIEAPDLTDLTNEHLAADPRIGLPQLPTVFLLQPENFGAAAMIAAEFTSTIQRIEFTENSEHLSVLSVTTATILRRNKIKGFNYSFGANDAATIARLITRKSL